MRRLAKQIALIGALLLPLSSPAWANERPVTVELFTSQSCYSCPSAEAFLNRLAVEEGVVALEFHVDYWNQIVYGAAGQGRELVPAGLQHRLFFRVFPIEDMDRAQLDLDQIHQCFDATFRQGHARLHPGSHSETGLGRLMQDGGKRVGEWLTLAIARGGPMNAARKAFARVD